jgi:hypothetical protein
MSENTDQNQRIKKLSVFALIAAIASIPLTIIIAVVTAIISETFFPNFWGVIFIIIIPIGAMGFSIYALKKNVLGFPIATILVGGFACILIVIVALLPNFVNKIQDLGTSEVIDVEQTVSFDFPASRFVENFQIGGNFGYEKDNIDVSMIIEVSFDDAEEIADFESRISHSALWETGFNELGKAFVPLGAEELLETGSNFMVYNVNTGEYNIFPAWGNTYECLFLAYDDDDQVLTIYRFTITV